MNPSIRPDINYLSVIGDQHMPVQRDFSAVDGSLYASVLKFSDGIHDQEIKDLVVPAGNETAVDCDWATNVGIAGQFGDGPVQPDNVLRFKGPFRNCSAAGFLLQRGKRNGIDIEVGNHFDQHLGLGSGLDLTNIEPHKDGGRVTFAVGWVVPFTVKYKRANLEYLIIESIKLKLYVATKHLLRLILRIPAGTKGPAWF